METVLSLNRPATKVIHADCCDVLESMRDECIDLVFTDPPFNIDMDYIEYNDKVGWESFIALLIRIFHLSIDKLKPSGQLVINCPDNLAFELVPAMKGRVDFVRGCIWHYRFGQHTHYNFISSHVHCLIFAKDKKLRTWNPNDILVDSDRAVKYNNPKTWNKKVGTPGKRVPLDVFEFSRIVNSDKEKREGHPNQLPERYCERIIRGLSNPGDIVLDLFAGSGTIGTVARALSRKSISIETSEQSANSAADRIKSGAIRV